MNNQALNKQVEQPLSVIDTSINKVSTEYRKTVSDYGYGLVPESQMLAARKQVSKSGYAIKCAENSPLHLMDAIRTAGVLGVDLTEGKRQGWLVPRAVKIINQYGKEVNTPVIQFQVGYKGIEAIHQRLGVIDRLSVRLVYEHDEFEWSGDDKEKPTHNADWFNKSNRGELKGAFCVTYYPDGSINTSVTPLSEIYENHRDKSDSWKKESARQYSPWSTFPEEMIKKTMVGISAKQWPAHKMSENDNTSHILEKLHESEVADYQDLQVIERDERYDIFFDMTDAIGMYLLNNEYLNECDDLEQDNMRMKWQQFWSRFPKGHKGKLKEREQELISIGEETVSGIIDAINSEDDLSAKELLEGITKQAKPLLEKYLGESDANKLRELVNPK